ncbi:MAG: sensor histidine kinase [Planctomycetes bacterium]|nr:sensor histidine kinase [Planctomycetota bacterium]
MAPDELPHIFEEFFCGQEAKKAVAHGTRLGMAIVMLVVEMHRGEIEVQSAPGKGTRFVVMLSVAEGWTCPSPALSSGWIKQSSCGLPECSRLPARCAGG